MKANPVLVKEIKIGTRTIRLSAAIFLYALIMMGAVLFCLRTLMITTTSSGEGIDFTNVTTFFSRLAYVQMAMVCLVVPVLTGASIAGEREKQTLDILLSTPVSSMAVILGKLYGLMLNVLMFVIASVPAMAVAFLYGGMPWHYLLIFLAGIVILAFFNGAIGLWCSVLFRKTIQSVIVAMLIELAFFALPLIIILSMYMVQQSALSDGRMIQLGLWPLLFLLDPAANFIITINNAYNGGNYVSRCITWAAGRDIIVSPAVEMISRWWILIGAVTALLLGVLFIFLAARGLNAARRYRPEKNKEN